GVGPDGSDGTKVSPRGFSFMLSVDSAGSVSIENFGAEKGFQITRFHHQATLLNSGSFVVFTGGCGCTGSVSRPDVLAGKCPSVSDTCTGQGKPRVSSVDVFDVNTGAIS